MTKTKKTTAAPAEAPESFNDAAERLGAALADVVSHPNCPADVRHAIEELDTAVFNHCSSLEVSLRYSFPMLLVGLLAAENQRPAD